MFKKLIIATGNQGKYKEFVEIIHAIGGRNFADEIIFAPEISRLVVEETGSSYAENSMLKSRAWTQYSGLPCLADDSGLEVNALNGAPGLYSARVIQGSNTDKALWLLTRLQGVDDRKARFTASLCLCVPDQFMLISEGHCYGTIAHSPKGINGFGYDPVFVPEGFGQTFAELTPDIKNKISHRTNAFKKIFTVITKGGSPQ